MKRSVAPLILIAALLGGCVHSSRPGEGIAEPGGVPTVRGLISAFQARQTALADFEARGRFIVKLPDDPAAYSFRNTRVCFSAPDWVFVEARKHGSRAFLLTATDVGYVVMSPAKKTYYHGDGRFELTEAGGAVPAVSLVRELLLGTDWSKVSPRRARITSLDRDGGEATVEIHTPGRDGRLIRRLVLRRESAWDVHLEQYFDADSGRLIAETTREGYTMQGGTPFPERIETRFAGDDAWMRLEVSKFEPGVAFEPGLFDVDAALADARRRGYALMETIE